MFTKGNSIEIKEYVYSKAGIKEKLEFSKENFANFENFPQIFHLLIWITPSVNVLVFPKWPLVFWHDLVISPLAPTKRAPLQNRCEQYFSRRRGSFATLNSTFSVRTILFLGHTSKLCCPWPINAGKLFVLRFSLEKRYGSKASQVTTWSLCFHKPWYMHRPQRNPCFIHARSFFANVVATSEFRMCKNQQS